MGTVKCHSAENEGLDKIGRKGGHKQEWIRCSGVSRKRNGEHVNGEFRVRIRHWLAVVIAVRFRVLTAFGLLLHVFLFQCAAVAAFIRPGLSSAGERRYLIGHRDKLL